MEFDNLFKIIELTILVIALFLVHNSFPAGKVKELIELLKVESGKTDTPVDDLLVQVAELLNSIRVQTAIPILPPADSGGELSPE